MGALASIGRSVYRGMVYPAIPARSFVSYWLRRPRGNLRRQVEWLQRTALAHARWLNLKVRVHGDIPQAGLVACNHISYLDIVALSAAGQYAFVAKKEVGRWPLFGAYARLGATIFIDRERRGAVANVSDEIRGHLHAGIPLVLFPEGTSSDGTRVLPFRSSLLEPVVQLGCPVTPCGLRYTMPDGSVTEEVAYWGDMTLGPHLLNLIRKQGVTLDLHFGTPRHCSSDRKQLARELREEVAVLAGAPVQS